MYIHTMICGQYLVTKLEKGYSSPPTGLATINANNELATSAAASVVVSPAVS